ncbi:MAG: TetR/AcrR family transcriptional regulator [Candidatus Binatia bacterium]|nr:TetR/AcrR family transcriptional regulator [Candidatus Binatia bacterium]
MSERRKLAIDTHMNLVMEGHLPPTIEQVASRSGISVPTLFRYFRNLDELLKDSAMRSYERHRHLFQVPEIGVGSRDERIRRFAGLRVDLWEKTHFLARLLRAGALQKPEAAQILAFSRKLMADQIRAHFDTELRALSPAHRGDAVVTVATITSVESWEQFRLAHGRTPVQTRRAWSRAIDRALGDR